MTIRHCWTLSTVPLKWSGATRRFHIQSSPIDSRKDVEVKKKEALPHRRRPVRTWGASGRRGAPPTRTAPSPPVPNRDLAKKKETTPLDSPCPEHAHRHFFCKSFLFTQNPFDLGYPLATHIWNCKKDLVLNMIPRKTRICCTFIQTESLVDENWWNFTNSQSLIFCFNSRSTIRQERFFFNFII